MSAPPSCQLLLLQLEHVEVLCIIHQEDLVLDVQDVMGSSPSLALHGLNDVVPASQAALLLVEFML